MVYEALQRIFRMINIFEEEFAEKHMAHYGMVKKAEQTKNGITTKVTPS